MLLAIKSFMGIAPRLDARRIPDTAAQTANNCDLRNGVLRALRGTSSVWTPTKTGNIRTIYRFGQTGTDESLYWFHWTDDVDVVKGQIANDVDERTYFAGDSNYGHPRVTKASLALIPPDPVQSENLLEYPTAFDNLAWSAIGAVGITPNSTIAPDGTMTADTVTDNSAAAYQGLQQAQVVANDSGQHTVCIYVRKTTGGTAGIFGVNVNLTGGTSVDLNDRLNTDTGEYSGAGIVTVDSVGDHWRFAITITNNSSGNTNLIVSIYPAVRVTMGGGDQVSATGSAVIWGATLVPGATALDWLDVLSRYPLQSYRLGVPAPASAPTSGGVTGSGSGTAETRAYVYTYVTGDGEEGQPSLPVSIVAQDGQTVTLNGLLVAPTGYNITSKRIYRTVTTLGSNTDYQFVAQITDATTTYADPKLAIELAETMPSLDWDMPPSSLKGFINLPNGMVAGFDGSDVLFSEPYRPFAWPEKYRQAVDYPVVGLGAHSEVLVVLTRGIPYLMFGSHPGVVSVRKVEFTEACVSKRSIVSMSGGVLYATPNGLARVGPQGAALVTEGIIDKEFWTSLNPSSIEAYEYDGRYIGIFNNGAVSGFQFDPEDANNPFSLIDVAAIAGFNDKVRDSLYLNIGGQIVKWDSGGTPYTYTWRSKIFEAPEPVNFGWGQAIAGTYPVTMKVYGDGTLRHTQVVGSTAPFRLPSGFTADDWEIELTGINKITAVYLAQSADELKAV